MAHVINASCLSPVLTTCSDLMA